MIEEPMGIFEKQDQPHYTESYLPDLVCKECNTEYSFEYLHNTGNDREICEECKKQLIRL